jgi:hypothetical protein
VQADPNRIAAARHLCVTLFSEPTMVDFWSILRVFAAGVIASGVTVPFIYHWLTDRGKRAREQADVEATLIAELSGVTQVGSDLWSALGERNYKEIVRFYIERPVTRSRADFVLDYWNKAARMYVEGHLNRRRFLARVAPHCHIAWNDFSDLLKYFQTTQPERIAHFRKMHIDAARYIARNQSRLDKLSRKMKS